MVLSRIRSSLTERKMHGILIAMPAEARCFSSSFRSIGTIYPWGQKTLVAVSGMGELASQAAQNLIQQEVECLISCGTAAGLAPHIQPGTLCIPQKILSEHQEIYHCDSVLRRQIIKSLNGNITIEEGDLLHTPNILQTSNEKEALYQCSAAAASDMESFFIAQEAQKHQIPFLALRVVIDDAHFTMPRQLIQSISANGEVALKATLLSLCKHPSLLSPLITLAINFNKSRKVLKRISQMDIFIN